MRLGAQPFLVKKSFICMRMKSDFDNKRWAATLVLKQRPGWTRKWPIASCKIFQDSLGLDSRYRIPDSLSLKLRFWISVLSRIPDSVSWIPDSKPQNSEFHCKKFQYFIGIRNSLHEENDTTILFKPQLYYTLTTACEHVVTFSAWVVGRGGNPVVLVISKVGGGKVADGFDEFCWGIGPKNMDIW